MGILMFLYVLSLQPIFNAAENFLKTFRNGDPTSQVKRCAFSYWQQACVTFVNDVEHED